MFLLHRSNEDIFWPLCSKLETNPEIDRVAINKRCEASHHHEDWRIIFLFGWWTTAKGFESTHQLCAPLCLAEWSTHLNPAISNWLMETDIVLIGSCEQRRNICVILLFGLSPLHFNLSK